ncbi:S8 family serine peptidase [Ornithinibacillus contaminans]|uniref:S8 family serine peptidase n=1 Tax=Ornithinibacillus contaminans TaxID=694055 RepID=UPI00069EEC60|nr:S8 family serine peptidase [Ornithinibacillus contaminans]
MWTRKLTMLAMIIGVSFFCSPIKAQMLVDDQSIIIEVEGNPEAHKEYIETYHPFIEVMATYDTLFNGLALQGAPKDLAKMGTLDFIKAVHTVQHYEAMLSPTIGKISDPTELEKNQDIVWPAELNNTTYTGKGITVGVIDTGIDYNHPDLQENYIGGYDVVDLDDDPMETQESEGIPTEHGSHVAGIIAANGNMKGVAPNAKIRSYRALGPGGSGTSVQVIAAMEQAVQDGVDVINLSLGNSVNGPDYPTSVAVNRASELGVAIVIANGNSGPENWTVGAPATARNALAVGAFANSQTLPMLYDALSNQKISPVPMMGSVPWDLTKSYEIVANPEAPLEGKIALLQRGEVPFYDLAKQAEEKGAIAVIIYNNEQGSFQGAITGRDEPITIPVVSVSKKDGKRLLNMAKQQAHPYLETIYEQTKSGVATFSSRGPVTVNWEIKPDVLAPGTNILSTVPGGGYMPMQGTSMASPHVAGVVALLKEAHPNWTNEQIFGALKTTAYRLETEDGTPAEPIGQGMGKIDPKRAIETTTIIHNPSLGFGKIDEYRKTKTMKLTIENTGDQPQRYSFSIPKKQKGLSWKLPMSFTVEAGKKLTVPVELGITSTQLEKGIHQGWLELQSDSDTFTLPYLFINETADFPKATGFEFSLKPFSEDEYVYRLYVTEKAKSVSVELYDPQSLVFDRILFTMENIKTGMNEGYMSKREIGKPGYYLAIITVQQQDGTYESYQTELMLEPDLP